MKRIQVVSSTGVSYVVVVHEEVRQEAERLGIERQPVNVTVSTYSLCMCVCWRGSPTPSSCAHGLALLVAVVGLVVEVVAHVPATAVVL